MDWFATLVGRMFRDKKGSVETQGVGSFEIHLGKEIRRVNGSSSTLLINQLLVVTNLSASKLS